MDLSRLIREAKIQEDRESLAGLSFEQRASLLMGHLVIMLDILTSEIKDGEVSMDGAENIFTMFAISMIMKSWGSFEDFINAFDGYCRENPDLSDSITRMRKTSIHFSRKKDDT